MGCQDPQTPTVAVPLTHPCCRAKRTKPLRFFRMSVVTPGRQESDSATPPMTTATALPVPFLDSRYPMARRVTGHSPAAERTTGAVGLPAPAVLGDPLRDPPGTLRGGTMQGTAQGTVQELPLLRQSSQSGGVPRSRQGAGRALPLLLGSTEAIRPGFPTDATGEPPRAPCPYPGYPAEGQGAASRVRKAAWMLAQLPVGRDTAPSPEQHRLDQSCPAGLAGGEPRGTRGCQGFGVQW